MVKPVQLDSTSCPELLIDLKHYESEVGEAFTDNKSAYNHYCASGEAAGLNPSPFFFQKWYRWQNPDSAAYPTALAHFDAEAETRNDRPRAIY